MRIVLAGVVALTCIVSAVAALSRFERHFERDQRLQGALANALSESANARSEAAIAMSEADRLRMALAMVEQAAQAAHKDYLDLTTALDAPTLRIVNLTGNESKLARELASLNLKRLDLVKALNAWIFTSIEASGDVDPSRVLIDMRGRCGDRDIVFSSVAEALGIPSRRISFFNVPVQLGHTATEFFVDNRWRFFDSTAGLYFTRKGSDDPISIVEARTLYPNIDIWQAEGHKWTGIWQPLSPGRYRSINTNFIFEKQPADQIAIDIERTYFAATMAGAPEEPVFFSTLSLSARSKQRIILGSKNDSALDLANSDGELYAPLLERVGRYDDMLTGNRLVFRTGVNAKARVRITYVTKDGHILTDLDHSSRAFGREETSITPKIDGSTIEYTFEVRPPASVFSVWARGSAFGAVDQVEAEFILPEAIEAASSTQQQGVGAPSP